MLNNSHTWLDGLASIGGSSWNAAGTELTITLSADTVFQLSRSGILLQSVEPISKILRWKQRHGFSCHFGQLWASRSCRFLTTESAAIGASGALLLAIGYGADYSKRHNLLLIQGYLVAMLALVIWLIGVRYYGFQRMNWVFVAAAAATVLVFAASAVGKLIHAGEAEESVFLTARTTAMVCWLFVGSAIFSSAFALLGGQAYVEQFVLSLGLSSWGFMLMAQFIIFLLGWPLEWTEIIIIFLPIFLPLLKQFGIDPLFFGVMVALNLQTSFLSPPVAMAPFYLKGVAAPHVTITDAW